MVFFKDAVPEMNPLPAPALRTLNDIFSLRSSVASRNGSQVFLKSLLPFDIVPRYCHKCYHQHQGMVPVKTPRADSYMRAFLAQIDRQDWRTKYSDFRKESGA
jgi:hypothetical protein